MSQAFETQVGGDHYRRFNIQPTKFAHINGLGFIEGNIVKYICRYKFKGGKQDLEKIKQYVDQLIELEYPEGGKPPKIPCPNCSGSGWVGDEEICGSCGGTGKVIVPGRTLAEHDYKPVTVQVEFETPPDLQKLLDKKAP